MKKSLEILFTRDDERVLSEKIRAIYPDVAFIDDVYWPSPTPAAKASIAECDSRFVLIWNREMFPILPSLPRRDGTFHGPQSGMVLQLIRSTGTGEEMLSGSLGVGFDPSDVRMKVFVEDIWKIVKELTHNELVQISPDTREVVGPRTDILLGDDARAWCNEKPERVFRFFNSRRIVMRPSN
ncbi:MAG: hypothetical protein IPM59_14740 [Chloracidobacterium sp.]|nr:hypothetical protein [Chloracidobacterium sp.]